MFVSVSEFCGCVSAFVCLSLYICLFVYVCLYACECVCACEHRPTCSMPPGRPPRRSTPAACTGSGSSFGSLGTKGYQGTRQLEYQTKAAVTNIRHQKNIPMVCFDICNCCCNGQMRPKFQNCVAATFRLKSRNQPSNQTSPLGGSDNIFALQKPS